MSSAQVYRRPYARRGVTIFRLHSTLQALALHRFLPTLLRHAPQGVSMRVFSLARGVDVIYEELRGNQPGLRATREWFVQCRALLVL